MDRNWNHNLGVMCSSCPSSRSNTSLDTLPLCPPVLEPDLDLDLGQTEVVGNLRPLAEAEILLAVELLLELQQLLAGEGGPPSPGLARATPPRQQGATPPLHVQPGAILILVIAAHGVTVLRNI